MSKGYSERALSQEDALALKLEEEPRVRGDGGFDGVEAVNGLSSLGRIGGVVGSSRAQVVAKMHSRRTRLGGRRKGGRYRRFVMRLIMSLLLCGSVLQRAVSCENCWFSFMFSRSYRR